MKRHHKITLASFAVVMGIMSGILTIVEKSITIVNSLGIKSKASEVPENVIVEKGFAGRVDKIEKIEKANISREK